MASRQQSGPGLTLDQIITSLDDRELSHLVVSLRNTMGQGGLLPASAVLQGVNASPIVQELVGRASQDPRAAQALFQKAVTRLREVGLGEKSQTPRASSVTGQAMQSSTSDLQQMLEMLKTVEDDAVVGATRRRFRR